MTENVPKPIRSASDCVWRRERRLRESWDASRRLAERLGAGLGTLLDASWPLLGHPGRHLVGFGAPLGRPRGAPSVSGRVPKTALGAESSPGSIFRRFFVDCASVLVDFLMYFSSFVRSPFVPPAFCSALADSDQTTRRLRAIHQTISETRRFRVRLAFCCFSLPARPPRSSPQPAIQRL